MPHTQIGVQPVPSVNAELFRRAFSLPGVQNRPTIISMPGARALWLDENVPLAHPELILAGREFTHVHPDGSMHLTLPVERAREAIAAGWAEPHPIARQIGMEGMVLVYTPRTFDELHGVPKSCRGRHASRRPDVTGHTHCRAERATMDAMDRTRGASVIAEYHLIRFSGRTASTAFIAALSRYLDSPSGSDYMGPPEPAEVWIDARAFIAWVDVYLSNGALAAARSAFAPVPMAGAVPGVLLPDGSILLIGGGRSPAWGMAEAERRLEPGGFSRSQPA